jgi:putative endonuclease
LSLAPSREQGPVLTAAKLLPMSEAWVYLLRCNDGSLYTGWTIDLERRLACHRAGTASRYTASRLPVELAHAIPMPDRSAARREEARVKRLSRADKLALLSAAEETGTTSAEPGDG